MDRIIISKQTEIKEGRAVITETTETKLNKEQLEIQLNDLSFRKRQLKNDNKRIIEEYAKVEQEEIEMQELISQLENNELVEIQED